MQTHQPIQPLELDCDGILRFKENAIVRYILDNGNIDLNHLARLKFNKEDRQQFAQLIGYSLGGYEELSYVTDKAYGVAVAMIEEGLSEKDARIVYLENELDNLRAALKEPIARLYGIHPDDLDDTDGN